MTREQFIEKIAPIVVKYAPQYNILCPSAVIGQAVLESDGGNSELAVQACNYFGLKYRANRCPSACGIYYKKGSEQNADGSYIESNMQWMKFSNMDDGVKGYFDFTNISNYSSVKGIKNPKTYLENIKKAGYATSLKYVENVYSVVQKYNLTKYDKVNTTPSNTGGNKMVINTHAGHNPEGKVACGAIGFINESTEARKIQSLVNEYLKKQGHTVYDCTVSDGTSANNVLSKIVEKCNTHTVDLDVSIHFNASAKKTRDGKTTGTEVYVYNSSSKAKDEAQRICNAIAEIGFTNRGVKYSTSLYVLRKTKAPALLIEVCFVDDPEDVDLYNANIDKIARKIVKGITGVEPSATASSTSTSSSTTTSSTPVLKATATKKGVQTYLNTYYGDEIKAVLGAKLTVDGIFGEKSKKAVAIAFQTELNKFGATLKVDGLFGSASSSAFIEYVGSLKKGSKGIFVTLWQCLLVGLGYSPNGIDGDAGNGFVNATNLCLKAYGLSGDSVVNGADINKIL